MGAMDKSQGTGEVYDETDEYDRQHGRTTLADEQKAVNLTDAANKAPPQYVPFKVTTTK